MECVGTYQENEDWYEDAKIVCLKMDSEGKEVKISLQKIVEYCTLTTAAIFKIIPYYWNLKQYHLGGGG